MRKGGAVRLDGPARLGGRRQGAGEPRRPSCRSWRKMPQRRGAAVRLQPSARPIPGHGARGRERPRKPQDPRRASARRERNFARHRPRAERGVRLFGGGKRARGRAGAGGHFEFGSVRVRRRGFGHREPHPAADGERQAAVLGRERRPRGAPLAGRKDRPLPHERLLCAEKKARIRRGVRRCDEAEGGRDAERRYLLRPEDRRAALPRRAFGRDGQRRRCARRFRPHADPARKLL